MRIDARTVYEPDALVRCGPKAPGGSTHVDDPVIVAEVVSPASRGVDSGAKLTGYFGLPSLRHYLVVNADARAVAHHRRGHGGEIATRILRDGGLVLDPPGIAVEVADVFATL